MATPLWVTRGVIAGFGAVVSLFAALANRKPLRLRYRTAALRLAGPHLGSRTFVPQRRVARRAITAAGAVAVSGLSKSDAEDLLDWLEVNGFHIHELDCAHTGFIVRYR